MKKILFLAVAMLVTVNVFGKKLPDIKVEDQKGEVFQTATLVDGKTPAIISFWSTICKPCIQELDAINDQLEDWQKQANFRVITISTDDVRSSSRAKALASGHGWDFINLYDKNQDFQRAMGVTSMPHVFVMDAEGNIVYSHNGYTPGSEIELFEKVKEYAK